MIKFNNEDLNFDIENIKSFNPPISISKEFDRDLDNSYAIDIEDESYFYAEQNERDKDFEKLKTILKKFSFIE